MVLAESSYQIMEKEERECPPVLCPWCTCERCNDFCIRICCCCCYHYNRQSKDSSIYPHVFYRQIPQQGLVDNTHSPTHQQYSGPPINRRYKFPQKHREFSIPSPLEEDKEFVVKEQPHSANPSPNRTGRTGSYGDEEYSSDEVDADTDTMERGGGGGRRESLCVIQRSPESTLKRGQHITFPTDKKMSLNTLRPLDASLLEKLEALKPETTPLLPGVHFTLYYDAQKSMLIVHLNQAVNLSSSETPEDASNCFCQVYLLPVKSDVQQSQCVQGTYCPIFDRVFGFGDIPLDELRLKTLIMRFYVNHNHFVGGVLYHLKSGDLMGNKIIAEIAEYDEGEGMKESCQGDILLSLCYHSMTSILDVYILEVSNLKRHDIIRMPNPYVKVNLIQQGQRISKWKTSTKKGTVNPIYQEVCEVDVSGMEIEDVQLDIVVMDYDRLGHNHEIGCVMFGDLASHMTSGVGHWKKVMIETNTEVFQWHPLIPHQSLSLSRSRSSSPYRQGQGSRSPLAMRPRGCFRVSPSGLQ